MTVPIERGIMFRDDMVRAILRKENPKRVTRRMSLAWLKVKKGDRLYVRECWRRGRRGLIFYRATDEHVFLGKRIKWQPSIFMFKRDTRIWLTATEDARQEPLLDITEEDAKAEGVLLPVAVHGKERRALLNVSTPHAMKDWTYREAFLSLWSEMHRKKGERVEDNPRPVRIAFDLTEVRA